MSLSPKGGKMAKRMANILAIANQKGGVAKTTTALALGVGLAELGRRVLLVDLDPQASLTVSVGLEPHQLKATIYDALAGRVDAVTMIAKGETLHLLPSTIDLAAAEVELAGRIGRESILAEILEPLINDYDQIIIDCPPSLGLLTINALTAADFVLVPVSAEFLAVRGLRLLMATIDQVKKKLNPRLQMAGVLVTMLDTRVSHSSEVIEELRQAFGDKLLPWHIKKSIRFAEAPLIGQSILTYAPTLDGANSYRELAKVVDQL